MDIYLKKLELHGFKSFPEKVVIQFHKGITTIIGPNGCGKSNLVDAILWVLGEQRIKNLRGEENQDLIFNGSSSKKPLGMTEVGIFIANKDEETYIARRFFRNGEGKYILNEKFCRNKDIQDVLFDLGIGERAYYIFEQGSVEKMVSLKPTERRIMIEEAAGIAQYLEKKKETANKLIIAQQNLDSLEIIIIEKGKRLKELKNQAHYVQRYRAVKNQRGDYLKALLKKKFLHVKGEFDAIGLKIEQEISQETLLAKAISDAEEKLLKLEQERWEQERRLKNDQQQLFQVNSRILNCQKENEKVQQRIGFLRQRSAELKNVKDNGRGEINALEEREKSIGQELGLHVDSLKVNEDRVRGWQGKINDKKEQLARLQQQEQEMKKRWFETESEAAAVNNQTGQLEKNSMRIENEIANKRHLLQELESQAQAAEILELEKRITQMEKDMQEKEQRVKASEKAYQEFLQGVKAQEELVRKQRLEVEYLKKQKTQYEKIKEKIKGTAYSLEELEHEGSFQEHIQADKKAHRLLENFYHDEMDAIILRRPEEALKSSLPKAILSQVSASGFPREIKTEPGFVGFVKDMYTLDNPELRSYFKDGVLVDNLRHGIDIFLKYGVHVVTQNAEVITRDGLLVRNREKGILEVLEEIKETEKSIRDLLHALHESEKALEKEREKEKPNLEDLQQNQVEYDGVKKQFIALQSQLEIFKKTQQISLNRMQINRSETEALTGEWEKIKKELAAARMKREQVEQRRKELASKRDALTEEMAQKQKEIAELEKTKVNEEHLLALAQEKRQSADQFFQDITAQKQKLLRQMQSADKEILSIEEEIKKQDERNNGLQKDEREAGQQKSELEKKLKDEEEQLNSLDKQIKEIQTSLSARRNTRDEVRERKKELEITMTGLKRDLFQLEETSAQELNLELKDITGDEQLMQAELPALEEQVSQLTDKVNKMRENDRLNFSAEAEVGIMEKDYNFLLSQKEDVLKSIQDMHAAIQKIDAESKESFTKAFAAVRENFITNFKILFEGGEADLLLTEPENILESGLDIQAQPPGKRLQSIRLLSGGEKTLTSLAFLFSLFQYKPSPFCVFDEVDASLDEANIQRFLNFLLQLKEKTQFVIITHNFKTMEKADYIYGISMDEPGISKIYSMKMN